MNVKQLILFFFIALFAASCSNTKNLGSNQNLFVGADEKIKSSDKLSSSKRKGLESEMHSLVRPKPNTTVLGVRFKLTVYNMFKEPKKPKGILYWLKHKVGEPPVLASNSVLEKNRQVIQNHLDNKGYFRDSVQMDTSIKNKKLKVTYTALLDTQYRIKAVSYPSDSSVLAQTIQRRATKEKYRLLKPNDPYDLDIIKAERTRVDARLKEHGFFYFAPEYLVANIDSTVGNHKLDIDLHVKPETPFYARKPYYINDVYVFTDFDINGDTSLIGARNFHGYTIIDPDNKFRPTIFRRTLVFDSGDLYNRTDHNLSLNRLITLGVYKFVKVRFEPADTAEKLNAFYYLTPTNKKSIRFQVSALTKTNNATGGEFSVNWRNRNIFRGAELLTISANAGFQKQISGGIRVNTLSYGLEGHLFVPRVISPFKINTSSAFVPQTKFSLGYSFFNRTTEYVLNSASAGYGYVWKNNVKNENELTLFNINFVKPTNITDSFRAKIDTNLALARSVQKQFILGTIYNYNYNTQAKPNTNRNNFYFNGNIDVSGNLIGWITGADLAHGKQKKVFGEPFTQYIRLEADVRHYLRLGNQFRSLNTRFDAGVGYAYGNDTLMPFIKAFFAGGVSDLRGFRARTLGPGSYYAGNPRDSFIYDQPGDVKLLMSLEYRAKLFSVLRYALFADAGNIWNLRKNDSIPGGELTSNFLNDIAIDVGVGLRVDISILILRLDIAIPVRLPYLPAGQKWNKIDFGDNDWRKNNIVWNLAIGYPF
ncbi:MAG TPA: BamA/TamA family outer membrane protein [Parafilimonas sp.]|nr:BamA/TamA family outer membrane protein [Parafilimonas sp.]